MMLEPGKTPELDDDEPVDPDICLMADYLSLELSESEADAVEDRLLTDKAFYEKVGPLIAMWTLPTSFYRTLLP